jgi:hypothetical protein
MNESVTLYVPTPFPDDRDGERRRTRQPVLQSIGVDLVRVDTWDVDANGLSSKAWGAVGDAPPVGAHMRNSKRVLDVRIVVNREAENFGQQFQR